MWDVQHDHPTHSRGGAARLGAAASPATQLNPPSPAQPIAKPSRQQPTATPSRRVAKVRLPQFVEPDSRKVARVRIQQSGGSHQDQGPRVRIQETSSQNPKRRLESKWARVRIQQVRSGHRRARVNPKVDASVHRLRLRIPRGTLRSRIPPGAPTAPPRVLARKESRRGGRVRMPKGGSDS